MKKVGIMTLHVGDNYGALLQCYALRKSILSFPGVDAHVINFDPGREFPRYDDPQVQAGYMQKLQQFNDFNSVYNGVQPPVFFDMHGEDVPVFDYYITGSDQVWNTSFSFANSAYFLDFVKKGAKKIAYAPSIGIPAHSKKLKKHWFAQNIPSFNWLSLRERSHIDFLRQYTNKEIYTTVDPTLLLEKKDYDTLCHKATAPVEDYILLYFLKHDQTAPLLISYANMLARMFHLRVVYSFAKMPDRVFPAGSETFFYSDPIEFVNLIKHARAVVTNSFHGTIFSLLYHRPFFTYLVSSMSARVTDLLHEVGLESRSVHGYRRLTDEALELDFSKADQVIKQKRAESIAYLRKALDID